MQLTKNFTLAEFNFRGYDLDENLIHKAQMLAENLQVIRDFIGKPIKVTSWYRQQHLNTVIGGSKTSQHLVGEAVDFVVPSLDAHGLDDLFAAITHSAFTLPHDCSQVIRETKGKAEWIHMGLKTLNWLDRQKATIADPTATSGKKSQAAKRLTNTEALVTPDGFHFDLVKYLPYGG
jgi:hypothetical protein